MNFLARKNVLVLGLGASGLALVRWCVRCGAHVTVADTRAEPPQLQALQSSLPTAVFVQSSMDEALFASAEFDLVLKSPGLSPAEVSKVMSAAESRGIARGNELSLFSQALADLKADRGYAPKVIGITGTNGKTTVTSLTGQLIRRAGKSVAIAGNIGPTLLDTLAEKLDQEPEPTVVEPTDAVDEVVEANQANEARAESAGHVIQSVTARVHPSDVESVAEVAQVQEKVEAEAEIKLEVVDQSDQIADRMDVQGLDEELTEHSIEAVIDSAVLIAESVEPNNFVEAEDDGPVWVLPPAPPALPVFVSLPDVWVLELSSFQLDGVSNFEPTVATVLNVTQDHLDWHETMPAYISAKARVYGQGMKLLMRDDPHVMAMLPVPSPVAKGKQPLPRPYLTFGAGAPERPGDYGIETINGMAWLARAAEADETLKRRKNEEVVLYVQRLMPVEALRIRGRHNATNALAALGLAGAVGCPLGPMLHGLREYRGEPHRVESVAVFNDVEYFDDSKGTNVGATVAALAGLGADRKLVIILGGEGKGQDFTPLVEPVLRYARAVILIGRDAPLIKAALQSSEVPLLDAASMEEAVNLASAQARTGDAVLMSPACASFDMFDNYGHRAQVFCDAVQALAMEQGMVI